MNIADKFTGDISKKTNASKLLDIRNLFLVVTFDNNIWNMRQ